MAEQHTERCQARQQQTPRGQECQGCADQGELLTRADIEPTAGGPDDHQHSPR